MDRKTHWEQVYTEKSPLEVSWYQAEPLNSIALIEKAVANRDAPIIDIGGGASLLVDRLLQQGFTRLAVLDISARALEYAQARLAAQATRVEWYQCDITRFCAPHRFTLWHDRAVFHFLTEAAERRQYIDILRASLQPGGALIIAAFAIGGPKMCSGLHIRQYDAERMQEELGKDFQLQEECSELHTTPANQEQQFNYFWFKRVE